MCDKCLKIRIKNTLMHKSWHRQESYFKNILQGSSEKRQPAAANHTGVCFAM